MSRVTLVTRRRFLGDLVSASALVLGARLLPRHAHAVSLTENATWNPGIYLGLEPDGTVLIIAHRSEMGTGIRTALPMVVADELDADWSRVKIEQATGSKRYSDQNTDGSRSISKFYDVMRVAGASARQMLMAAAANRWGVRPSECRTEPHEVVSPDGTRRLGYGELVREAARQEVPDPETLAFKEKKDYRYVGKPMPVTDLKALCSGRGIFGMDADMPGMVHASIERCPVLGGKLVSHDDTATLQVAGVLQTVVLEGFKPPHVFQALGGVAVIAENTWAAMKGREALQVTWDHGHHGSYDSVAYREFLLETVSQPQKVARRRGNVDEAMTDPKNEHEASYYVPHLAHVSMEPPVAVAEVKGGRAVILAPTQNPQAVQEAVSAALGIPEDQVECYVTLLGGGFGRKSKPDYVVEAALLSSKLGRPVKVTWTREDDIQHDYLHAAAAMYLKAALTEKWKPTALLARSAFPSILSTFSEDPAKQLPTWELDLGWVDIPFDIPNLQVENGYAPNHVRIGWLRSVCNIFHAFAQHSFLDELAHLAGRDPVEYLLEVLGPGRIIDLKSEGANYANYQHPIQDYPVDTGRLRGVIELAAEKSGWAEKRQAGRALGIAAHRSFLSYVAAVVEVEVADDGRIRIPRVDMAVDVGKVISPDRVVSQFEGSAVFGASIALMSEITAEKGAIQQGNFDAYRVARMPEAPREVRVHIVESDAPPSGVGEPGVPPIPPAICNAYFVATGKRIRELPIERL